MAPQRLISSALSVAALSFISIAAAQEEDAPVTKQARPIVKPLSIEDFKLEAFLVVGLGVFAFVWYLGAQMNANTAKSWTAKHQAYLASQFAMIGTQANSQTTVTKDGPADYFLYVTGRRNVQYGHWWLNLKPRNDLFAWFFTFIASLAGFAETPADVNVDMTLDKRIQGRYVFAVLPKKIAKSKRDNRWDLRTFAKVADSKLSDDYVVYAESQKLSESILTNRIVELINKTPGFESLIVTSMPEFEPEKYTGDGDLRMELSFAMSDRPEPVELACELPDVLGSLNLTADIKSKLRKNRESLEKMAAKLAADERANELSRKKAEAKKAEAERVKSMSASEQRKWDEKERARELKKTQKKRTKRM
ncbi:hypothetical protein BX666DRAFT_2029286 [Dichotomocladium elegans]|nr:hypothetical protein BX666DRAFT_2029286 [Dichotomocladium elegans]